MANIIGQIGYREQSVSVVEMNVTTSSTPKEVEAEIARCIQFIRERGDIITPEPENGRHRRNIMGRSFLQMDDGKIFIIIDWEN